MLVIDEAQNLTIPTLEAVRLLSNFETNSQKLMQILLVGQPELGDKLNAPELRQLKQRIGLRCHIGPLSPEEARLYIRHRLRIAGATDAGIFTDAAVQRIAEYSQGIPRVINIICDHCLLSGFADSKRRIDTGVVREAVEYLEEGERPKWRRSRRRGWCRAAPRVGRSRRGRRARHAADDAPGLCRQRHRLVRAAALIGGSREQVLQGPRKGRSGAGDRGLHRRGRARGDARQPHDSTARAAGPATPPPAPAPPASGRATGASDSTADSTANGGAEPRRLRHLRHLR